MPISAVWVWSDAKKTEIIKGKIFIVYCSFFLFSIVLIIFVN